MANDAIYPNLIFKPTMNGNHHRLLRTTWDWTSDAVWGGVGASTLLYTVSALLGVWAAYDRVIALERFANLSMGLILMLLLVWQIQRDGMTMLYRLCQTCAALTGALGLYFLLTHDWAAGQQYDFAPFQTVAISLQRLRPQLPMPLGLHENLAANILSILIPLSTGAIILAPAEKRRWVFSSVVGALALGMATLVMTFSRGAWAGIAVAALLASYLYWRTGVGRQSAWQTWLDWLVLGSGTALCVLFGLLLIAPVAQRLETFLPTGSTPVTHLRLWQDSMSLIRDYRYTGSGLGVSAMVYSTYYFLVHVPYLQHAHNLLLQVGVEQGAVGIIGFAGMVVIASLVLWQVLNSVNPNTRKAGAIGAASLAAMMLHGLTDATLYAGPFALITFLPIGFALSLMRLDGEGKPNQRFATPIGGVYSTWQAGRRIITSIRLIDEVASRITRQQVTGWIVGATPVVAVILFMILWPGSMAAIRANWGAVLQTRAELSTYAWPEWPVQDMLRRTHADKLEPAAAQYRAALALNPNNVTANRRLGHLALSMGQYDVARRRLEKARAISRGDRTTIQLLGEVYAAQGEVEQSAFLLAFTPADLQERLQMRKWWHEYIDERQEAAWLNEAIVQIGRR